MINKINEYVVVEVDGHNVNIDKWDINTHLARLKKEGRSAKIVEQVEETPPLAPTKTQLVNDELDKGETDEKKIAKECNCSIGLVKTVINKRE